jgi:nitrous oxidase accessory protein NosD
MGGPVGPAILAVRVITMRKPLLFLALAGLIGLVAFGARVEHDPIVIRSDADFTPENGVIRGSGTVDDPYVIAGWKIDEVGASFGILIQDVSASFLIQDVEICGAKTAGIKLVKVKGGTISDVVVEGSAVGIEIFLSQGIRIKGATIRQCEDALHAYFSSEITLTGLAVAESVVGVWFTSTQASLLSDSRIEDCDLGVKLELGSSGNAFHGNAFLACRIPALSEGGNSWDDGRAGNYWQGFDAPDADGDGILDEPYRIGEEDVDHYPLASPPA